MVIETPIGNLEIIDNDGAIIGIRKTDKLKCMTGSSELQEECARQILEFLSGNRHVFELPIELIGTEFQKSVWNALLEIPFGVTMTYGEIANRIGKPKAARAVGGACNKNPILLAVPCHRVIGADGKLVGFAAGLDVKSKLLDYEKCEVLNV